MPTINVTQEHIENGYRKSCRMCPIALAIQSICEAGTKIAVYLTSVSMWYDDEVMSFNLPPKAAFFIDDFDSADKSRFPSPITFKLDIPQHFLCSPST